MQIYLFNDKKLLQSVGLKFFLQNRQIIACKRNLAKILDISNAIGLKNNRA